MNKRIYIDLKPLLNSPAWWKEAFTDRGDGKTSALVKTAILSRLESGLTPVFCRRWGTEMGEQFKKDILEKVKKFLPEVWKAHEFVWTGNLKKGGLFLVDKQAPNDRPYMHAFPLSMVAKMKSGLDVETHRNLYIDEYVPLDGKYIKNEPEIILELYRTIDRDKLLEANPYLNYVLIAGNRIGRTPATDLYFGVDHNYNTNTLNLYKNNTIAIFTYANKSHVDNVKSSKLAFLVANTPYDNYAQGEQLRPTKPNIWQKKLPDEYVYIKGANGWIKCYIYGGALIFKQVNYNESHDQARVHLTIDPCDNSGAVWIKRVEGFSSYMRTAFAAGYIYYTDTRTAETHSDIVQYLSRL